MYQWRVTDGEVFEADPRCYLIVYDAVSVRRLTVVRSRM